VARGFYLWRVRVLAAGAIAVLMLITVNARGQSQGSAPSKQGAQETLPDSKPPMIQLDVEATGQNGKFVDGLGWYDFRVEDGGQLQTLLYMDHFVARNTVAEGEADEDIILIDLDIDLDRENVLPIVIDRRMIVLYFDLTQLTREEQKRSVEAAAKFIKEEMTAADLVAVVSLSDKFRVISGFTNNREVLEGVIAKLDPEFDPTLQSTVGPVTDEIEAQDERDPSGSDETERAIFDEDNNLYSVEALATIVGKIPGRKSVIEFTKSSARTGIAVEGAAARGAASNAANRNAVSFYVVDMRESEPPNAAEQANGDTPDADQTEGIQESRKAFASMAEDTNGKFFADVKDFDTIFHQVRNDSQDYYLLTYSPWNVNDDGGFRNVSVTLESGHGAQIKYQRRYYSGGPVGSTDSADHD
jgi:VWFA-related protein